MKKWIVQINKRKFIRECKKFIHKNQNVCEIKKFVESKCKILFPDCDKCFITMAIDYAHCLNNIKYSKMDFDDIVNCYQQNKSPF